MVPTNLSLPPINIGSIFSGHAEQEPCTKARIQAQFKLQGHAMGGPEHHHTARTYETPHSLST